MMFILITAYVIVGLWVAFNTLFKGGPVFTNIYIENNYLNLVVAIICGAIWPGMLLIPIGDSIFRFFKSF